MSLLLDRHGLLSTGHHGNFPGNGARAKTRKLGKMGLAPMGPRGLQGSRGACRYPYGSAPTRQLSPHNRIFFPFHLDPNQDP